MRFFRRGTPLFRRTDLSSSSARADDEALPQIGDDLSPEHFDHVMDRLFEAGALDVSLQAVQGKKNRPAFLLRALARPSGRLPVADVLFAETTTLGVRVAECDRLVLEREVRRVATPYGPIAVKFVRAPDGRVEPSAEMIMVVYMMQLIIFCYNLGIYTIQPMTERGNGGTGERAYFCFFFVTPSLRPSVPLPRSAAEQ